MRQHPLTPMTDANLVRVLDRQSHSSPGLVALPDVEAGVSAIRARFDALLAAGHRVALVDALTNRHVGAIAEACTDLRLVTGGAALGGALGARGVVAAVTDEIRVTSPVVILSGSCSAATRQQIDRLAGAVSVAVNRSAAGSLSTTANSTSCLSGPAIRRVREISSFFNGLPRSRQRRAAGARQGPCDIPGRSGVPSSGARPCCRRCPDVRRRRRRDLRGRLGVARNPHAPHWSRHRVRGAVDGQRRARGVHVGAEVRELRKSGLLS